MAKLQRHPTGYRVSFTSPSTREPEDGRVIDEVWAKEPEEYEETAPANDGWRQAAFVSQLIESGRESDPYRAVRITYWVRSEGEGPDKWRFGGQYSPYMSIEEFREMLRKLNQKNW